MSHTPTKLAQLGKTWCVAGDFGPEPHLDRLEASSATRLRRGEFSATDSGDSKASSTATTPKEASRKIQFNHQGNTPPGHYSGASWEAHERKKRTREDGGDGDDGAIGGA